MEILLFNETGLAKIWYVNNVDTPFIDKVGTEERRAAWAKKLEMCMNEGYRFGGRFTLFISVRSRLRASDITDDEMRAFNELIDNIIENK